MNIEHNIDNDSSNSPKSYLTSLKSIIFDFDGTLADSFPLFFAVFTEKLNKTNLVLRQEEIEILVKDVFYDEIKNGNERQDPKLLLLKVFFKTSRRLGLTRKSSLQYTLSSAYEIKKKYQYVELFEGAKELLEDLHERGITLILITHSSKKNVQKILEKHGLLPYFNIILDRGDIGSDKTQGIILALRALGIEPKDAIAVGDLPADIIEAKSIGVKTIAFSSGLVNKSLLQARGPDYTVESIAELSSLLSTSTENSISHI